MTNDNNKSEFKRFISYFKPHKKWFILDLMCALTIAMIDLAFPFVSRWCMYKLIPDHLWKAFWIVMSIILFAYVLRSIFTYIIWYIGHNFGILVETDIRRDVFKHIQKLSFEYFDNCRIGQLISRLTTDLFDITELAHHGPEDIFVSAVTIVGALIIMFTIQWKLALVIAIMIPVFMSVVWKCRKNMRDASRKVKSATAVMNTDFEARLSGMRTAKAFANEDEEYKAFDKANLSYKSSKYQYHSAMGLFNGAMEFFLCILSAIVIAVGGALIMNNQLNIIDLITFSLYITAFVNPIRRLAVTSELIANGTAGLHRFAEIMNTKPSLIDKPNAIELKNVKGDININNVSFSYKNNENVLKNVTLNVSAGETIAVVGASGGGKTTLSQLIPRFYDVASGSINIDGFDVREVTQKSLHKNIGIVQQDVFLFPTTIKENIAYGSLNSSFEDIVKASKMAEIYDDIMAMPNGFETNTGERGVLLSGGQKQRIAIARIFLKNPPILILDEATSALDSVTEAKIQKTLEKLAEGRTTIIIAHRLSTVRNADRIAVIDNGKIVEIGTHTELINSNGPYAKLVHTQELN